MIRISRWIVALVLYSLLVLVLLVARPSLMFDAQGKPKPVGFGLKDGKSMFAPVISFPIIAVVSYIMGSVVTFVIV